MVVYCCVLRSTAICGEWFSRLYWGVVQTLPPPLRGRCWDGSLIADRNACCPLEVWSQGVVLGLSMARYLCLLFVEHRYHPRWGKWRAPFVVPVRIVFYEDLRLDMYSVFGFFFYLVPGTRGFIDILEAQQCWSGRVYLVTIFWVLG